MLSTPLWTDLTLFHNLWITVWKRRSAHTLPFALPAFLDRAILHRPCGFPLNLQNFPQQIPHTDTAEPAPSRRFSTAKKSTTTDLDPFCRPLWASQRQNSARFGDFHRLSTDFPAVLNRKIPQADFKKYCRKKENPFSTFSTPPTDTTTGYVCCLGLCWFS